MNLTAPRLILIALAVILIAIFMVNVEPPTQTLRLVRPTLGLDLRIAEKLEALIDDHDRFDIVIVDPPEPGMSPVEAVAAGHADLAFAANIETYREDVNVVLPLYPRVLHVVTTVDPVPDDLQDLFYGRSIFAGPANSLSYRVVQDITGDMRLSPEDFSLVEDPVSLADVVVLFVPIDRQSIVSDRRIEYTGMFSFGDVDDIGTGSNLDRAVLLNPRLKPFVIPTGTYNELTPEPIVTVAVDNLLIANSELEETVVYDLFAEVVRVRTALFSERPELFQPLDKSIIDGNFAFSIHAGAMDYLLQDEPTFIERYSGVAEVLVTVLVAAVSGGWALVNIYRIRRKNRIDEFYKEVIRIRDSLPMSASNSERDAAVEAILELQNQAFELLVAEQLAADESFRIFIELTNNSIDRISSGRRVSPA
jgi:hypothetical protein